METEVNDGYRLITLGRLALLGPDGREDPSLAARRRKLVLLAILAGAKRPLSRDTLLALFWPEQDEERARHSLSDALSHLRRVIGTAAIATRQAEVSLSPAAGLAVDATEFANAIEAKDSQSLERAIALYGGPFLDGVHVTGSQELEEWIARERARLETLFVRGCEGACDTLANEERWDECGQLAARWLDAVPLSTEAALHRLNALRRPGTRDSAQRALADYRRLTARLKEDYDRGPDPAVAAVAHDLEAQLGPAATLSQSPPTPAEIARPPAPARSRRRLLVVAAAVLIVAALAGVVRLTARPSGEDLALNDRILVADFRNDTHDSLLPDAVTEALRVDLTQSRVVQLLGNAQVQEALRRMERPAAVITDSLAREVALRDGAKAFISGDVGELGTAFTISAQLVSAGNGVVLAAFRETARDSTEVIDAVDRLSKRVRGRLGEALEPVRSSPPLEQVTTRSLAALRDYSEAIRAGEREATGPRRSRCSRKR